MKSTLHRTLILALPFLCWTSFAFNVSPMVAEFDPNSSRSQQVFMLGNPSSEEKPVEVLIMKPYFDENGVEKMAYGSGEDLFLIIPQQFVLPPNSRRSVKVFYVGGPMEEEDTYRILFKELPVNLEEGEEVPEGESTFSMSIVMQYYTRIWLTPTNLTEELSISSFDKIEMQAPVTQVRKGTERSANSTPTEIIPMLSFTVANTGLRHGYLRYPHFDLLTHSGKKFTLSNKSIENVSGQVIFKQSQKEFKVIWEDNFPPIADIVEIRLRTARR